MKLNTLEQLGSEAETHTGADLEKLDLADLEKTAPVQTSAMKAFSLPLTWARTDRQAVTPRQAQRQQARRGGSLNMWYTVAVVLLMLASAAACVYRLFWAIQP